VPLLVHFLTPAREHGDFVDEQRGPIRRPEVVNSGAASARATRRRVGRGGPGLSPRHGWAAADRRPLPRLVRAIADVAIFRENGSPSPGTSRPSTAVSARARNRHPRQRRPMSGILRDLGMSTPLLAALMAGRASRVR
jgi:hypothetical protein